MTAAYKVKALINHSVFGLGIVQRVLGSQKVAVLFEDGQKTMRCKYVITSYSIHYTKLYEHQ